tara:strand:- start:173 stop:805 length:633 start_codon:yes stop_codon:yes gene_type:complete
MTKELDKEAEPKGKTDETDESVDNPFDALLDGIPDKSDNRMMALFGEVDEEKASELVFGLLLMSQEEEGEEKKPIEFYLSTYGGSADDMFSVYDMITLVKSKGFEIHTYGLGKVMSAGVLLLAAGTPGRRKIGKHCRIMIHSCNAGNIGDIHNLKNEMEAISNLQDLYINALVDETSMTRRQLRKLLDRKVNVYLSAEEAIEYGIADEII